MADTLQFDLVSPERKLASFDATEVLIPGAEGDMTAMADHMPVITTLRPGIVRAKGADGDQEYVVSGGFAEITGTTLSVLAEQAMAKGDVDAAFLDGLATEGDGSDAATKKAADLAALRSELGV
ncbi:ATP synthase epsilon chain [Candidatus Rhodobacter oscarellae]|uniref:ATP synthase epsilon chain n=1 Tax=Candidatus Rhodobacter oscarellae TaxID=1675527 RepID=A0A0J9DZI3_9RHOB|nr:F0F1 ATP synthase subunit epsilon [Candidatus Rhodobacter lobularis]KMW56096.1 ATP synthase epsilon chain [Candidatus Rhodobacter lobularis]